MSKRWAIDRLKATDCWLPFALGFFPFVWFALNFAGGHESAASQFASGFSELYAAVVPLVVGGVCAGVAASCQRGVPAFVSGVAGAAAATLIGIAWSLSQDDPFAAGRIGSDFILGVGLFAIAYGVVWWLANRPPRSAPVPPGSPTDSSGLACARCGADIPLEWRESRCPACEARFSVFPPKRRRS